MKEGRERRGREIRPFPIISGFRGAQGAMAPKMPKSLFFALHMQCIIKICAVKLIKFILNMCIFRGFHAPKSICFRGCAPATGPYSRSSPSFSAFGLNFGVWG